MKTTTITTALIAVLFTGNVAYGYPLPGKSHKATSVNRTIKIAKVDLKAVKIRNVEFSFAKTNIEPEFYPSLDRTAKLMTDNNAAVQLNGHTDNKGGYVYNWKLSEARALAVKKYLADKGADTSRIAAAEYGFTKPLADNSTATGRKKNRRVEVKFVQ